MIDGAMVVHDRGAVMETRSRTPSSWCIFTPAGNAALLWIRVTGGGGTMTRVEVIAESAVEGRCTAGSLGSSCALQLRARIYVLCAQLTSLPLRTASAPGPH